MELTNTGSGVCMCVYAGVGVCTGYLCVRGVGLCVCVHLSERLGQC